MHVLGPPVQLAYLVDDVRSAAAHWARERGAGPFFVVDHIALREVRVRGRTGEFDHSSAYGQWGPLMVELVCDHLGVFAGHRGLHHVAHFVADLADAQAHCRSLGHAEALLATTASGSVFAFHDATATLGHYLELYEPDARLRAFYDRVAAAADGWNGDDPVRER